MKKIVRLMPTLSIHGSSYKYLWFLLLSVFLIISITGCTLGTSSENTSSRKILTDLNYQIPDLNRVFATGLDLAEEWRRDAVFTSLDIDFAPITEKSTLYAFVAFVSGSDGESWYVVHIDATDLEDFQVLDSSGDFYEDPREDAEALELTSIQLSPEEAIMIGLATAEEQLPARILNGIRWPASAELRHNDDYEKTGPPEWSISLIHESGNGGFHVTIDDRTGEVLEIRNFME